MFSAIASIGGALLNRSAAKKAANAQLQASQTQADIQKANAARAEEAAKFRAIGFTSPYATPTFTVDDDGQLIDVRTELSPELQSRFDRLGTAAEGLFGTGLARAQDTRRQALADQYFGLGQQQLGTVSLDPTAAAAERTARMQELLAPQRAAQQEQLFSDLAAKGLTGLAVDQGMGASNPYVAALAQQQAQQDRQIAAQSLDLADQQIGTQLQRASGLFGAAATQEALQSGAAQQALAPYETLFGAGQGLYNLGQTEQARAMELANQERDRALAAAGVQAGYATAGGNSLTQGMLGAAQTRMAGTQGLTAGLSDLANNPDPFRGYGNAANLYNAEGAGIGPVTGMRGLFTGPDAFGASAAGDAALGFRYGTNPLSEQSRMLAAQDF
jgi:hypothetical protein